MKIVAHTFLIKFSGELHDKTICKIIKLLQNYFITFVKKNNLYVKNGDKIS